MSLLAVKVCFVCVDFHLFLLFETLLIYVIQKYGKIFYVEQFWTRVYYYWFLFNKLLLSLFSLASLNCFYISKLYFPTKYLILEGVRTSPASSVISHFPFVVLEYGSQICIWSPWAQMYFRIFKIFYNRDHYVIY